MSVFLPKGKLCRLPRESASHKHWFSLISHGDIHGYVYCKNQHRKLHLNNTVSAMSTNGKRFTRRLSR